MFQNVKNIYKKRRLKLIYTFGAALADQEESESEKSETCHRSAWSGPVGSLVATATVARRAWVLLYSADEASGCAADSKSRMETALARL